MRARLLLAALAGVAGLTSLFWGALPLSPDAVLRGLLGRGDAALIVREIRLPRAGLTLLIGASLGLSGAALQGLLRNPLAEPGLLGVSAWAGLGAVLALYFGLSVDWPFALPLAALAGAAIPAAALLALAQRDARTGPMILAGIALSSFGGALTALALNMAPNPYALSEMILWLLGSVRDRSLDDLILVVPFILAGWALLLSCARDLNALTLGDEAAASLGVRLRWLKLRLIAGVCLSVGASVAVAGSIGFIGLVVPHLVRWISGPAPGAALLPSLLAGAALLTLADLAVRLLPSSGELQLGVVTALIGAPAFIALLWRYRGQA